MIPDVMWPGMGRIGSDNNHKGGYKGQKKSDGNNDMRRTWRKFHTKHNNSR